MASSHGRLANFVPGFLGWPQGLDARLELPAAPGRGQDRSEQPGPDGKIYFATGAGATKLRNLKANPRVALSFDLYLDDWTHLRGVLVQGRTRFIERGPRFRKIRSALYRKYPQYPDEAAIEEGDSVIVEVTPSRVFSWGFEA